MTEVAEKLNRCRICGFTGPTVSPGVYLTKEGRYVTIKRCEDHDACLSRKIELNR